ncbi:MAG: phage holin family protein [Clostridia bacterium]|nr:phage holin family protein [Clostridia bacterium]
MKNLICGVFGLIGSALASLFGGFDAAFVTLLIFMALDYVSGIVLAGVFRRSKKSDCGALSSAAGFRGLCRKGGMLLIVLVACRLDLLLGATFIRDAAVIALVVNETISIIENVGQMGVPIPKPISDAIDLLKKKSEK